MVFVPLLVGAVPDPAAAQALRWARQFGTEKKDVAWGVALSGPAVYVCGSTEGTLTGQGAFGAADAFLRRYRTDGSKGWTRQFGTLADDACFGAASWDGSVVVAGRTSGKFPGQNRRGGFDAYLRAYDYTGGDLWTRQFGTRGDDVVFGVATRENGDIYVAGRTEGKLAGLSYLGAGDAFVRKYRSDGRVAWTREFGSRRVDFGFAVAADETGVYVVGATTGTLSRQKNRGEVDLFIRAYTLGGKPRWTHQLGTDREDFAYGVATDPTGVYVAGYTKGEFELGSGGADAVLLKYGVDGRRMLLEQFGTSGDDTAFAVASDGSLVFVVGATKGGFKGYSNRGETDAYARAFNTQGRVQWTRQLGTDRKDSANWVAARSGVGYVVGSVEGRLPKNRSSGDRDAFVASVR